MNDTIRPRANGDFDRLPSIDESMLAPGGIQGHQPRKYYAASSIGESNDPKRPGPTCARHWPTHHMDCDICRDTCNRRIELNVINPPPAPRQHSHYFKPCPYDEVDVYRVLELFAVTDPCLQHAIKKLLVAGGRGAGKDIGQDVKEAVDTLARWQEMRAEEGVS